MEAANSSSVEFASVRQRTLAAQVVELPFWYHRISLPGGVVTPGGNPLAPDAYRIPADLTGKRVLDVGAWDGYWTFEALRRGAREAVAIDDFSDFLGHLRPEDRHAWKSFDLCREALEFSPERCKRIEMSIYDANVENLGGRFDVIFCFGTLYHLRHPLLGLDKLSAVCEPGGTLFLESQICDDHHLFRGGAGVAYPEGQMLAEFFPTNELARNPTNWWAPTVACLCGLAFAAGFTEDVTGWKLTESPGALGHCRGFARGTKPR